MNVEFILKDGVTVDEAASWFATAKPVEGAEAELIQRSGYPSPAWYVEEPLLLIWHPINDVRISAMDADIEVPAEIPPGKLAWVSLGSVHRYDPEPIPGVYRWPKGCRGKKCLAVAGRSPIMVVGPDGKHTRGMEWHTIGMRRTKDALDLFNAINGGMAPYDVDEEKYDTHTDFVRHEQDAEGRTRLYYKRIMRD